ncbi:hypothetical protein OAK17_00035 [Alphaproteobacteria bacterium]|nr:hypothetical protein [Alphaproteobacteria bacterium]
MYTSTINKTLTGPEKACIMMITMGEKRSTQLLTKLESNEIEIISKTMKHLEKIPSTVVENVINIFDKKIIKKVNKLTLKKSKEVISQDSSHFWSNLNNINEKIIASYLKNEHPQTATIILLRINPSHAAKILRMLPENLSRDIVSRMVRSEPVKKEVLNKIEETLSKEIMSIDKKNNIIDEPKEAVKEILNHLQNNKDISFDFSSIEDLKNSNPLLIKKVLQNIDENILSKSLQGASLELFQIIKNNMEDKKFNSLMNKIKNEDKEKSREAYIAQENILEKVNNIKANG